MKTFELIDAQIDSKLEGYIHWVHRIQRQGKAKLKSRLWRPLSWLMLKSIQSSGATPIGCMDTNIEQSCLQKLRKVKGNHPSLESLANYSQKLAWALEACGGQISPGPCEHRNISWAAWWAFRWLALRDESSSHNQVGWIRSRKAGTGRPDA